MIKQKNGMSQLNPLEETAMELIVNSAARKYLKSGRGKYFTKTKDGMSYKYKVNRDFKKDLATRFQEKTNHLYNSANNTGFMNNQSLKAYNLYKKFAVKEFGRLTGLFQKGQYEAGVASIAGYGAIAGGLGLPFARDILNFYSWVYKTSMIEGGIVPDFGSGLPVPELLDPEYALRSSGDSWFSRLALTGVASTMGLDMSQAGAVNMSSHFDPRGTGFLKQSLGGGAIGSAADLSMNVVLGDTYIKISKLMRNLNWGGVVADAQKVISNPGDREYNAAENDTLIRVFEGVANFIPGGDKVMKMFTIPRGLGPIDYRGRPSNVYNTVFEADNPEKSVLPGMVIKALGGKTTDESMYEMTMSGRRKNDMTLSVQGRQQRAMKEMLDLSVKIRKAKHFNELDDLNTFQAEISNLAEAHEITRSMFKNFVIKHGKGKVPTIRGAGGRALMKQDIQSGVRDINTGEYVKSSDR